MKLQEIIRNNYKFAGIAAASFLIDEGTLPFAKGDFLFIPEIRKAVEEKADVIKAYVVKDGALVPFEMTLGALTDDEREIIRKGCLINYYRG